MTTAQFSKKVIQECALPHNQGLLLDPDGVAVNLGNCGDSMQIYLRITDGIIILGCFLANGCMATLACGSTVTQLVEGKSVEKALEITPDDVISELEGLPQDYRHCANLAVETLTMAVQDYLEGIG